MKSQNSTGSPAVQFLSLDEYLSPKLCLTNKQTTPVQGLSPDEYFFAEISSIWGSLCRKSCFHKLVTHCQELTFLIDGSGSERRPLFKMSLLPPHPASYFRKIDSVYVVSKTSCVSQQCFFLCKEIQNNQRHLLIKMSKTLFIMF